MLNLDNLVILNKESRSIIFPKLSKEVPTDKLVSTNFGSIKHVSGSRLTDDKDSYLSKEAQKKFIDCKINPLDRIIVSEKLDGMNAGIMLKDGQYYALNRRGYDVRSKIIYTDGSINWLFFFWAYWASEFVQNFNLMNNERLVFENLIMTHSLKYDFKNREPVYLLAAFKDSSRFNYSELQLLASSYNLQLPPILSAYIPVEPDTIRRVYPKSLVGCKGLPEGFVYLYESFKNGHYEFNSSAKFVGNTLAGTCKEFPTRFNYWTGMDKYLKIKQQVQDYWINE